MHINKIVHTNSGKVHKLMLTFKSSPVVPLVHAVVPLCVVGALEPPVGDGVAHSPQAAEALGDKRIGARLQGEGNIR